MSNPMVSPSPKPALTPPPGVIPNFVNPPSQGYVTVVVLAICLAITTPIVLLRIYVRYFINRRLWWDDCKLPIHTSTGRRVRLTRFRHVYHRLGAQTPLSRPKGVDDAGATNFRSGRSLRVRRPPVRDPEIWQRCRHVECDGGARRAFHQGERNEGPSLTLGMRTRLVC